MSRIFSSCYLGVLNVTVSAILCSYFDFYELSLSLFSHLVSLYYNPNYSLNYKDKGPLSSATVEFGRHGA